MKRTDAKNLLARGLRAAAGAPKQADYRHIPAQWNSKPIFEKPGPQKKHYPEEVRGLVGEAGWVRRRILANASLVYWLACWNFVLGILILAALFTGYLKGAIILAAILLVLGAPISLFIARSAAPSIYMAACKLDASARLQDRLSTTIHFAAEEKPDSMLLSQRRDSLARLKDVNAHALFPLQMPNNARRTAALALVVAGLFAYRVKYGPPGLALARKASRTHISDAVISPLERVTESAPLNVLVRPKIDALDAEAAAAAGTVEKTEKDLNSFPPATLRSANGSGVGQKNSRGLNPAESEANVHGTPSQNQSQANNSSASDLTQESRGQSIPNQNSPKTASEGKNPSIGQSKTNDQNSKVGAPSLGQQIVKALKEMMGNIMGQDASQSPSPPSPQAPGSTAQGQGGQAPESGGKLSRRKVKRRQTTQRQRRRRGVRANTVAPAMGPSSKSYKSHPSRALPRRAIWCPSESRLTPRTSECRLTRAPCRAPVPRTFRQLTHR